eukprot:TRINITY_DN1813_c0_g1_i1.p1 TRINITY_DN1813_c0_g1~~TRINITY_DN1813_c0_g1_i1.p1  ORF type:complete len:125 (+),score=18.31 TRINITY_DN1813_c0_g1_i1:191-565(+)
MLDCFGFRKVFFVIVTAQIAIIATITLIVDWDILYLLWICFTMFLEGGQLAIFPAVTTKVFGHKVGPVMYGFIFIGFAISNLLAYVISTELNASIGWGGVFWIALGISVIPLLLNFRFPQDHQW